MDLETSEVLYACQAVKELTSWVGVRGLTGCVFRHVLRNGEWDAFRKFQKELMEAVARNESIIGRSVELTLIQRPPRSSWHECPPWLLACLKPVRFTVASSESRERDDMSGAGEAV